MVVKRLSRLFSEQGPEIGLFSKSQSMGEVGPQSDPPGRGLRKQKREACVSPGRQLSL